MTVIVPLRPDSIYLLLFLLLFIYFVTAAYLLCYLLTCEPLRDGFDPISECVYQFRQNHCDVLYIMAPYVSVQFVQLRFWRALKACWLLLPASMLEYPSLGVIGLYRGVWIAAIAPSKTSLATLTGVMCNTSQCELRSLCVNSGMLNVIRIVTYYTIPPLESPDSSWIAMAFSR